MGSGGLMTYWTILVWSPALGTSPQKITTPFSGGALYVLSRYRVDGAGDVLHRSLGLDVGRLGLLVPQIRHDVGDLLVAGDVDRDELGSPAPVIGDLLHILLEVVSGFVL